MALKEYEAFTNNYAKLCNTLTDIKNLLHYFVQEKVIKPEDQDDINILPTTQEKVKILLKHVAGPLQAGDSKGFYTMLKIMKNHGVQATKDLAESLKGELSAGIVEACFVMYTLCYIYNMGRSDLPDMFALTFECCAPSGSCVHIRQIMTAYVTYVM